MPRYVVGPVDEIQPGHRKIVVPFRGRAGIGVFNVGGTFYALRNLCPHKSGPLCTGGVTGRMIADRPPSASLVRHWPEYATQSAPWTKTSRGSDE